MTMQTFFDAIDQLTDENGVSASGVAEMEQLETAKFNQ